MAVRVCLGPRSPSQNGAIEPGAKAVKIVWAAATSVAALCPTSLSSIRRPLSTHPLNGASVFSERQLPPQGGIRIAQRPFHPLPDNAVGIEHLIAQAFLVERGLNAMQILDAFRHPVSRSRARSADLQDTAMRLHIEGEDVAAQIGKHVFVHQDVPERAEHIRGRSRADTSP